MKLADAIAGTYDQGGFIIDLAMSGNEGAIELLTAAPLELPAESRCLAALDAITEARIRRDDDALQAALKLFNDTVRDRHGGRDGAEEDQGQAS